MSLARSDGLRLVEKSNWVGLGIICPRGRYPEVKRREEFAGSNVLQRQIFPRNVRGVKEVD